jgi:hypothetical protein
MYFTQPEGECTNCGQPSADLKPVTVAAYDVVLDELLCAGCRALLKVAPDALALTPLEG